MGWLSSLNSPEATRERKFKHDKQWHMGEIPGNPTAKETKKWLKPIKNPNVARIKQAIFDAQQKLKNAELREEQPKADLLLLLKQMSDMKPRSDNVIFNCNIEDDHETIYAVAVQTINMRLEEIYHWKRAKWIVGESHLEHWSEEMATDNLGLIMGLQLGLNVHPKWIERLLKEIGETY